MKLMLPGRCRGWQTRILLLHRAVCTGTIAVYFDMPADSTPGMWWPGIDGSCYCFSGILSLDELSTSIPAAPTRTRRKAKRDDQSHYGGFTMTSRQPETFSSKKRYVPRSSHAPIYLASASPPGGAGVLDIMHRRSRMTIDPRVPTMPGRNTSGLHRPS